MDNSAKILKLLIEIMRFREKERHVYSAAEIAAYEVMRRFAETGRRTVRRPS